MCSLLLQGCRSVFQVTSEEPVLKKARKTIHDERSPNQLSVPPNAYDSGLSIAASVNSLSSLATAAVQITSPKRHLAVEPDMGSFWQQALLAEPEEIDTKPAARLTSVFGVQAWSRYFGEVG